MKPGRINYLALTYSLNGKWSIVNKNICLIKLRKLIINLFVPLIRILP